MLAIEAIPAFQDNYIWCLYNKQTHLAYVVDPGDAHPVFATFAHQHLQLAGILLTHHHYDHIGGVDALLKRWPVPVYGPAESTISTITVPMHNGDTCDVLGVTFTVLQIPGHTLDHMAFYASRGFDHPLLFCGDTLFAGGCGRLFEGTAQQMYDSLQILASLPDHTRVYCAHEYTLDNLAFAALVEPKNPKITHRIAQEQAKRRLGHPTIPSILALEKATNPFLRCHIRSVANSAAKHTGAACGHAVDVFASIRHWKDNR